MAIELKNLTEKDKGRLVDYNDGFNKDKGRIKSWNEKWIFVVYKCGGDWDNFQDYTGCTTEPEHLTFKMLGDNNVKEKEDSQENG